MNKNKPQECDIKSFNAEYSELKKIEKSIRMEIMELRKKSRKLYVRAIKDNLNSVRTLEKKMIHLDNLVYGEKF